MRSIPGMKKRLLFIYHLLFLMILPGALIFAQKHHKDSTDRDTNVNINISLSDFASDDEEDRARADSVMKLVNSVDNLVEFTRPWKIKAGDDSSWATVNFDDRNWKELSDTVRDNNDYGTITWYRMHFEIDTILYNVPIAFFIRQFGSAADVYLDGKFLKSFGKVGKDKASEVAEFSLNPKLTAIVFTPQRNHVLAVRYSNFNRIGSKNSGFNIGRNFQVSFHHLNNEIEDMQEISSMFSTIMFFAAIFLTLAVVHLILFVYNSQKIANLYYSMYCFGIFIITFYTFYILSSTDYSSITTLGKRMQYLVPLIVVPLVAMLHTIFYHRLLKIFWVIACFYLLVLTLIQLSYTKAANIALTVLVMVAFVEIIRVIIRSVIKKRDGAWIFALAILLSPILAVICSFLPDDITVAGMKMEINGAAITFSSAVLGLPLSMTLYLARDFARMGKKLKIQLHEITELSSKTIEQELEKKQILQNQKTELERKVVERTQEVISQKEVIEFKNKEITESLLYAKRIQSAILPDMKLVYKTLEQSFILYLPKDIVSGDFYGFAQKNDRVIIAAADCTGHGVAGAFMSMIGTSLLNQIINERNITEPSQILEQLNEGIINSLKQRESESNDGMDISLCSFDLKNKELKYSGANRPLWMIRGTEMITYKPNKFPIGGMQVFHTESFQQHVIPLQTGDSIYLFSDGFADQFGGDKGKKLMTKKLKEELMSIQYMSMKDQEAHLHDLLKKWKGDLEQVDDILVIGIKIV